MLIHCIFEDLQNLIQLKTSKKTCTTVDKGLTHFYDDIIDIFYILPYAEANKQQECYDNFLSYMPYFFCIFFAYFK